MKSLSTIYRGRLLNPEEGTVSDNEVTVNGVVLSPEPSQKLYNHSPTGFSWGYGGSGPSQLALALLLDFFGKDSEMLRFYQDFKFAVVANWPQHGNWEISGLGIMEAMRKILA